MRFATKTFINDDDQVCVVGALARSVGASKSYLRENQDWGSEKIINRVAKALKLSNRTVYGLISLNDSRHWTRLRSRLSQLKLTERVQPFVKS